MAASRSRKASDACRVEPVALVDEKVAELVAEGGQQHVDIVRAELVDGQEKCDLVRAEGLLQDAFATDVRPAIRDWRASKGLPADPMDAFRQSGYLERITRERSARNSRSVSSYA